MYITRVRGFANIHKQYLSLVIISRLVFTDKMSFVTILFIFCASYCHSATIRRLERRLNILEDRVDFNTDVFQEDIQRIYATLNNSDTRVCCNSSSAERLVDPPAKAELEILQVLQQTLKLGFNREKMSLRLTVDQIKENLTRVRRDVESKLANINNSILDNKLNTDDILKPVDNMISETVQSFQTSTLKKLDEMSKEMRIQTEIVKSKLNTY